MREFQFHQADLDSSLWGSTGRSTTPPAFEEKSVRQQSLRVALGGISHNGLRIVGRNMEHVQLTIHIQSCD